MSLGTAMRRMPGRTNSPRSRPGDDVPPSQVVANPLPLGAGAVIGLVEGCPAAARRPFQHLHHHEVLVELHEVAPAHALGPDGDGRDFGRLGSDAQRDEALAAVVRLRSAAGGENDEPIGHCAALKVKPVPPAVSE